MEKFKNFVVGFICAVIVVGILLGVTSCEDSSALNKCQQALTQNAYCSGYHREKGEGKYYIYFRDKQNHEKIVAIVETVQRNIAEQYYKGE